MTEETAADVEAELKTLIGNRMTMLIQCMANGETERALRYRGELRGLAYGVLSHRNDEVIESADEDYVALAEAWENANGDAEASDGLGRGWE